MRIICDSCGAKYSIADEKVRGKVFKIKCKKCSHIIIVRGSASEQAAGKPIYDEKETKVFDYSGYDSPKDAAAAMAAADSGGDAAVWHLVIDQEQVGPMTVAEVEQRYRAGEVDADSYIWREGFGDWQRLAVVDDFAAMVSGGGTLGASDSGSGVAVDASSGSGAAAVAGMFGSTGFDDAPAQDDPQDLFSAQASPASTMGVGGGLFGDDGGADQGGYGDGFGGGGYGDAMAASGGGGSGLFDDPGGGGGGGAATIEPQLTGQRNENSVLFSLSNLASLASEAPRSSSTTAAPPMRAAAGTGGGAGAGMAEAGGSEGSGLIDIRSMAQVYLGDSKPDAFGGPAVPAPTDDLPMFGGTSFDAPGQVLLPTAGGGTDSKLLYALIALIGVLVIGLGVLLFVVFTGDDKQAGAQVAAVDPPGGGDKVDGTDTAGAAGGGDEGAAGDPAGGTEPVAAGGDKPEGDDPGADGPDEDDDGDDKGTRVATRDKPRDTKPKRPERSRDKGSSRPARSGSKGGDGDSGSAKPKEKCDEVACLVDPSLPCCGGSKSGGSKTGGGKTGGKTGDSDLPERPSRTDISSGIGKVRGRVQSCGDKHNFKGTVSVKIEIEANGSVGKASADKGDGSFKSCVTDAVSKAKFPKTQKGVTVNYPFVFR